MGLRAKVLGRCLPPVLMCMMDASLTLAGQPAEYWRGKPDAINEASPICHHLLAIHPMAFAAGILVWMGIFVSLILLMSSTMALVATTTLTVGHTYGAESWFHRLSHSYSLESAFLLMAGVVLATGIRFGWEISAGQGSVILPQSNLYRRLMIAALLGVTAYLFLG
jgi:hypothetical protein